MKTFRSDASSKELLELQKVQIDMMNDILKKVEKREK
jgi:hypothetical protein